MTLTDLVQKWDSEADAKFGRNNAHASLLPAILPTRKEHYLHTHGVSIATQYYASLQQLRYQNRNKIPECNID